MMALASCQAMAMAHSPMRSTRLSCVESEIIPRELQVEPPREYWPTPLFWPINRHFEGLTAVSADPPVYVIDDLLDEATCEQLIEMASPHLQQQVRDALDTHGMLLFPNQRLTPAEEAAFAKLFPWDQTVPMAECAGPFATAQTTGVYGVGGGGDEGLPAIAALGGNEGGAVLGVDRWKLPAPLSMVQIQGDGAVSKQHGVPDGELVSSQTFAEWHTDR